MKKFSLAFAIGVILSVSASAQGVGINSTNTPPHPSAMLDVNHPNKGVLLTRVALTGTADKTTIASPANSLLVYNTATAGSGSTAVKPGFYYWDASASLWVNLLAGSNTSSTAWLITGNSGTNANNFIGTTDNMPLRFRVNNKWAGIIADNNTSFGIGALQSITTGANNTATGYNALFSNTRGIYNTASGAIALQSNTNGNYNTASGAGALASNTSGGNNTATGLATLQRNTTGNYNTGDGLAALQSNTTGNYNTASGAGALYNNTTGSQNTAIGFSAGVTSGALNNTIAIGYDAMVSKSNTVQIGNSAVTDVYFGDASTTVLHANSTITPSDARFKYNVKKNVPGLDFITRLTPVTYYFDNEKLAEFTKTGVLNNSFARTVAYTGKKELHTGFLAQDVERIASELGYDFDGVHTPKDNKGYYSLSYTQFVMPLIKAVQEQQDIIETQQQQIDKLSQQIQALTKVVQNLSAHQ